VISLSNNSKITQSWAILSIGEKYSGNGLCFSDHYSLIIYNNSSYSAYNVSFHQISDLKFNTLEKLLIKNDLPSYGYLELKVKYVDRLEGIHTLADEMKLLIFSNVAAGLPSMPN
jgi:hypothetical protein